MEVDTGNKETPNLDSAASNTEDSMEPANTDLPICSRGMSDVFPIFVNMLDVKSFMNLSKTCKHLRKRCLEDKAIKINVEEYVLDVFGDAGGLGFAIHSLSVPKKHLRSYVTMLRKQRLSLHLNTIRIYLKTDVVYENFLYDVQNFLKQMGVSTITIIEIADVKEWEGLIPFIKGDELLTNFQEFGVRNVCINGHIPLPNLRSLLQLPLTDLIYQGSVPVQFVLELKSPVKMIRFGEIEDVVWPKFLQILWNIQSGRLHHLSFRNFDREEIEVLDYNIEEKEKLAEDKTLIFKRRDSRRGITELYFLHWQGGVTKCIHSDGVSVSLDKLDICKCPPNEFPPILRKDEDVLKDLAELVPRVGCYKRQFETFMDTLKLIKPSFQGPLPPERPLYFQAQNGFMKLIEDDTLMKYTWKDTQATWDLAKNARTSTFDYVGCRSLAKLLFNKYIQKPHDAQEVFFICESVEELDFWLEDYKKLDFGHADALPKERPLVFEKPVSKYEYMKFCVILYEDLLLECSLKYGELHLRGCQPWNRPPILIDAMDVKEILQEHGWGHSKAVVREFRVDHDTLLKGFQLFKTSLCGSYKRRPLVFEKAQNCDKATVEESWFGDCEVIKMVWKNGLASMSEVKPRMPFEFMKEIFKECAQRRYVYGSTSIYMNFEQFESCLGQFETLPFDYSGPLPKDRILAFVKKGIGNRVWFLSEGVNVSCGMFRGCVVFTSNKSSFEMPPVLKAKEFLRNILEMPELSCSHWYGSQEEFFACFANYTRISPSHKGPLPEERPLVVEQEDNGNPVIYLLRKDRKIIKCKWTNGSGGTILTTDPPFKIYIPSVLMSIWE